MGRHSIKVKIASLLTVIIAALLVLLILFNSIFAEKFYLKDKQKYRVVELLENDGKRKCRIMSMTDSNIIIDVSVESCERME